MWVRLLGDVAVTDRATPSGSGRRRCADVLIQAGVEPRTDHDDDAGLDDAEALWDEAEGFATIDHRRQRATVSRRIDSSPRRTHPRQAAQEPVGRENLMRLLASFPVPADDDVGAMDPRRLGAALGLD